MRCRKKSAIQYIMASLWPENTFFHSTVRRSQGCIHTCQDYWYLQRLSALSHRPLCILTKWRMSELVCWIWRRTCYGWLQECHFHNAERSFKYWASRKKASTCPSAPQILITSPLVWSTRVLLSSHTALQMLSLQGCSWLFSVLFCGTIIAGPPPQEGQRSRTEQFPCSWEG